MVGILNITLSLLTDFVCLYNYEFGLSLCKIVRSSVTLLLPLLAIVLSVLRCTDFYYPIVASVARHAGVLKMKFNMCSVDEIWTLGTFRSENLRRPLIDRNISYDFPRKTAC
jgi:hypothetical protein